MKLQHSLVLHQVRLAVTRNRYLILMSSRQKNSIVLFDEIAKGTPELWNILLQIMEDGEIMLLTGGRGIAFRNAIIILTTNISAKEMIDFLNKRNIGFRSTRHDVEATGQQIYQIEFEALQRHFPPEWINRIDEIITFRPLSSAMLSRILDRMLDEANQQYLNYGIRVELTAATKAYLLNKGYQPSFGARPLWACLLKHIDAPLADLLASGGIPQGSRVLVDYNARHEFNDGLSFYYQPDGELEIQGRKRRESGVHEHKRMAVWQESSSPSKPQGPSMDPSVDGTSQR